MDGSVPGSVADADRDGRDSDAPDSSPDSDAPDAGPPDAAEPDAGPLCPEPHPLWVRRFGEEGSDGLDSLLVDANGEVVVTGSLTGEQSFFAAKLHPDGQLVWTMLATSGSRVHCAALAPDTSIYLAGSHWDAAAYVIEGFLAKLTPDGQYAWQRNFPRPAIGKTNGVFHIVVDPEGAIYAHGSTGVMLDEDVDTSETWLGKYDPNGGELWQKSYGSLDLGLLPGSAGPLVTGFGIGNDPFGSGVIEQNHLFLAELGPEGQPVWLRTYPCRQSVLEAAAPLPDGGVLLAGIGTPLDCGDSLSGVFVAKLDATGNIVWTRTFPAQNPLGSASRPGPIALDSSGHAWVPVAVWGSIDFGVVAPISTERVQTYLLELDRDGTTLAAWRFPNQDDSATGAIAFRGDGNLLLAGSFSGRLAWCSDELVSAGYWDGFLIAWPR